jgi:hypothetical protein
VLVEDVVSEIEGRLASEAAPRFACALDIPKGGVLLALA